MKNIYIHQQIIKFELISFFYITNKYYIYIYYNNMNIPILIIQENYDIIITDSINNCKME